MSVRISGDDEAAKAPKALVNALFVGVLVLGLLSWPWVFWRYFREVTIEGDPHPTLGARRRAAARRTLDSARAVARWLAVALVTTVSFVRDVLTWPIRKAARLR
jgi:hypothetical protein